MTRGSQSRERFSAALRKRLAAFALRRSARKKSNVAPSLSIAQKGEFLSHLTDAVSDYSYSMYAEVDSAYETEGGEIQLTMLEYELLANEESYAFKVVRAGPS